MISISTIKARYEESDQMGFIHHSNHIVWMEQARMNLLRDSGINYKDLESTGVQIPVIKVVTNYVSPAFFDDEVTINTAFTRVSNSKFRVDYLIMRSDEELLCYGHTEHCLINKNDKKPIRIPDTIKSKLLMSETALNWISRKDK